MAGHSHSANIKYRKDRQDSARGQLFIKVRRKLESVILAEGEVNEKSLSIARENKFPKEKVYQIWEKIKLEKEKNNLSQRFFYQAPFGIWVYLENDNLSEELTTELGLKKMPLNLLSNYFQLVYILKLAGEKSLLEEYLLTSLPTEIWEKVSYNEKQGELLSSDKEAMKMVKNTIKENPQIAIAEEKNFWQTLIIQTLNEKEEKDYYLQLKEKLKDKKFYTNIEY